MTIEVYGKQGCAICEAAKAKLKQLGLPFTEHKLAEKLAYHTDWRGDGTVGVMAMHANLNLGMPIILIDGKAFSYPGAMRRLKDETTPS